MRSPRNFLALTLVLSLATSGVQAESESSIPTKAVVDPAPLALFDAIEAGQVDARFVPADAARANVILANKTDRVLHLQLPDAIAAVPVLGQLGQQFGGQPQGGAGRANQALGGALGGVGNQGFGNGLQGLGGGNQGLGNGFGGGPLGGNRLGAGGFMRIPPHKSRKLKAVTVCLEHGKPEPNPRLAYRMIPINQYTQDQRVASLCERLGRKEISQNTAQAAAWHLANNLSWRQISAINRIESRYLGNVKMFTPTEIARAKSTVLKIASQTAGDQSESLVNDYGQTAPR